MGKNSIDMADEAFSAALAKLRTVSAEELKEIFGFSTSCNYQPTTDDLRQLKMPQDDIQILKYLVKNLNPQRHLEFGTWTGAGALAVLQNSNATVWSINLRDGEITEGGQPAYAETISPAEFRNRFSNKPAPEITRKIGGTDQKNTDPLSLDNGNEVPRDDYVIEYRTDARGMIGHLVHEAGLSDRFHQIYADSKTWDIAKYQRRGFDTVLIDGGHDNETVLNDSRKAIALAKPGGTIIWHDFCPDPSVYEVMSSCQGVVAAILELDETLATELSDYFWVDQTWMLVGRKRTKSFAPAYFLRQRIGAFFSAFLRSWKEQ